MHKNLRADSEAKHFPDVTVKLSFANGNGSNGGNTFPKNLMAPILFHPKVDGSSGLDDKKSLECDHDATVHKVCYDPMNADS